MIIVTKTSDQTRQRAVCVCVYLLNVCVCVVIPFILDVRLVDVQAEVTQEEGHTGVLHLPSAVLALMFLARMIQPFLSLVGREVELCVLLVMNQSFESPLVGHFIYLFTQVLIYSCEDKSQVV